MALSAMHATTFGPIQAAAQQITLTLLIERVSQLLKEIIKSPLLP